MTTYLLQGVFCSALYNIVGAIQIFYFSSRLTNARQVMQVSLLRLTEKKNL